MVDFDDVSLRAPAFDAAEATQNPLDQRFFFRAVQASVQAQRNGLMIDPDSLHGMDAGLPVHKLRELMTKPMFARALEDRGIAIDRADELSAHQQAALAIYLDMSVPMSHQQRLRAAKVTQAQWDGWLREARFSHELATLSEERLKSIQPTAHLRLAEQVDKGERWAIEFLNEMTGRHDRRQTTVNVPAALVEVAAILDEELAKIPGGEKVMLRIGAKMQALISGAPEAAQEPVVVRRAAPELEERPDGV